VAINVGPSVPKTQLTHHIHLDGQDGNEIGLILCDNEGNIDPLGIRRRPYPRSAIKTYSGQQKYSDLEPPFEVIAIDDLSGGRGGEKYDDDQSLYMDGWRVDALSAGRIFLGGQETYCTGEHRDQEQNMPGSVSWNKLHAAGTDNASVTFTPEESFTVGGIWLWLRKIGAPSGDVEVALEGLNETVGVEWNQSTDTWTALTSTVPTQARSAEWDQDTDTWSQSTASPDDYPLLTTTVDIDTVMPDKMSVLYKFDIVETGLSAGGSYSVKVTNKDASGDADDCIAVAEDASGPYYRVVDTQAGEAAYKFFSYRRQLYAVSIPYDGGDSALYMCGYRGAADSNSGEMGKLVDSAANFGDDVVGGIVYIIAGPGSQESQNWRTVASRSSTGKLVMDSEWEVEHTTDTEYVIFGTDHWQEILDLGDLVTDVAVADKYVYFSYGDSTLIKRYQEYNDGGTWTTRNTADVFYADKLLALRDPNNGNILYGTLNNDDDFGTHIWRARVPRQWGDLYSLLGTLTTTDTPWDEQEIANVTQEVDGGMTKIDIAAAFGTGNAATEELTAVDITEADKLGFLIKSSVACSAGDLRLGYSDTASLGGTPNYVNVPALDAGEWAWVAVDIDPKKTATRDDTAIISVGLDVVTDNGAQTVYLQGGILLLSDNPAYTELPSDALITGLDSYTGGQDASETNPWVFTENNVYEIQASSSYVAVPLAVRELASLRGANTGKATTMNDVYLYFSLGEEKLEQYYNRSLNDVGPDLGAGLPSDRRGHISALASYPGGVYMAVDAGDDGYSSVLVRSGGGLHEVYRAPQPGVRIEDIAIEPISGSKRQRLWISQYGDLVWVPVALNPENSEDYRFCHDAMLQVGKAFSSLQDVEKFFKSIKLISEDLSDGEQWVEVDWRVDGASSWTTISNDYVTSTSQEEDFSSGHSTEGVYVEVRLRFYTNDNTKTPVVLGIMIEALTRVPVKFAWDLTIMLKDRERNLIGDIDDMNSKGADKLDILDGWVNQPLPVRMYSWSSYEDDTWVFVEPSPVTFVNKFIDDDGVETRVAQVTLVGTDGPS
jgi:hypothetical protein